MPISQLSRWDNVGTEAPAGDAEYVAGQQPIAEHDNYFNWSAAKDVENLIAALENVTTGHDHDGANSKQVDGSDVVNTPAGNIVATDVQAAIDELDTEKLAEALFDANTIMKADSDDTPAALTVAEQTLVGRITAGVITALTAAQARTLLNVENGADVTDATNVDAAGAAMNSDKDAANGIAGLDASGELSESGYAGILKKYLISDNVLHSHLASLQTSSLSYVKLKTITLNSLHSTPSTLRVLFDLATLNATYTAYGRIYKNGAAVGVERSTTSITRVSFTEDIAFADGDTIEVWLHTSDVSTAATTREFDIKGDEHDQTLAEAIAESDIGVADPFVATNS